jgi:hypothetical protein
MGVSAQEWGSSPGGHAEGASGPRLARSATARRPQGLGAGAGSAEDVGAEKIEPGLPEVRSGRGRCAHQGLESRLVGRRRG